MAMTGRSGQWFDLSDTEAYGLIIAKSIIPFGRVVVHAAGEDQCVRLPDNADQLTQDPTADEEDLVAGIVIYEKKQSCACPVGEMPTMYPAPAGGFDVENGEVLNETEMGSIGTQGRYYVRVENDVTVGMKAYFRITTNAADPLTSSLGTLRGGDDSGGESVPFWKAKFVMQSALAGGIAIIDISV